MLWPTGPSETDVMDLGPSTGDFALSVWGNDADDVGCEMLIARERSCDLFGSELDAATLPVVPS